MMYERTSEWKDMDRLWQVHACCRLMSGVDHHMQIAAHKPVLQPPHIGAYTSKTLFQTTTVSSFSPVMIHVTGNHRQVTN